MLSIKSVDVDSCWSERFRCFVTSKYPKVIWALGLVKSSPKFVAANCLVEFLVLEVISVIRRPDGDM